MRSQNNRALRSNPNGTKKEVIIINQGIKGHKITEPYAQIPTCHLNQKKKTGEDQNNPSQNNRALRSNPNGYLHLEFPKSQNFTVSQNNRALRSNPNIWVKNHEVNDLQLSSQNNRALRSNPNLELPVVDTICIPMSQNNRALRSNPNSRIRWIPNK